MYWDYLALFPPPSEEGALFSPHMLASCPSLSQSCFEGISQVILRIFTAMFFRGTFWNILGLYILCYLFSLPCFLNPSVLDMSLENKDLSFSGYLMGRFHLRFFQTIWCLGFTLLL